MLDHYPLFDETLRHIELCNMRHRSTTAKSAETVWSFLLKGSGSLFEDYIVNKIRNIVNL